MLILYDLQAYNTPNRVLYVRLLFSEDKDYAVRAYVFRKDQGIVLGKDHTGLYAKPL